MLASDFLSFEIIVKNIEILVRNNETETSTEAIVVFTIDQYKDRLKTVRVINKNNPHLPCLYKGFILF